MNCKKCGCQLRENAKFCDECGEKVDEMLIKGNDNSEYDSMPEKHITESENEDLKTDQQVEQENSISIYCDNSSKESEITIKDENTVNTPINKKKWFIVIIAIIVVLIIIIIAFTNRSSPSNSSSLSNSSTTTLRSSTTSQTKTDKADEVQYIGARSVDYEEETSQFRVFFRLMDSNEVEVDASGTASISIQNDNGESVFNKEISFTKDDFTSWTNAFWDESRYMACIYIPVSDITKGTIETGTLSLEVTLSNGAHFDKNDMKINSHLPLQETTISLPSVPNTYKEFNYKNELKYEVEVKEISYKLGSSYDGEQTVTILLTVEMLSGCANTAASSQIGYSLTDSKGIVVDSGTIYNTSLFNGETTITEKSFFGLKVGENYTLKLNNAK